MDPESAVDQCTRPAASAPLSVQGTGAVNRARGAKVLRDVASMSELRMAEEEAQASMGLEGGSSRMVAGRLFQLEGGVGVGAGVRESGDVLDVAAGWRADLGPLGGSP